MVRVYPFAALMPVPGHAGGIAAVPYDVVSADEAAASIRCNPESFLRVSRSDAELPGIPPDDPQVYLRARENLERMRRDGLMVQDASPGMYIYRVLEGGSSFTGIGCCLDARDYLSGIIRVHEATRYDKEADRTAHISAVNAHTGAVVLVYRDHASLTGLATGYASTARPDVEVTNGAGALHQIFRIDDPSLISRIQQECRNLSRIYIADGHHRAKSAVNVACDRFRAGKAGQEDCRFMGVLFGEEQVRIHGYSRLLTDISPYKPDEFLELLGNLFSISPFGPVDGGAFMIPVRGAYPAGSHTFHPFLGGEWYECSRPADPAEGQVSALDVSVLQERVFSPILGISDPRGDPRLQYLGGARPLSDLERMVRSGRYAAAFSMQPVRVETVCQIADSGGVMPPKSTWFEPKLLSGLLVHLLD
jgi:uncharacterized protein (DUF1015 family)